MSYCAYCGKKLERHEACQCEGAIAAAAEKKQKFLFKNKKPLGIIVACAAVVVLAIVCVTSFGGRSIDLSDYIRIDGVDGLNGNGILHYSFDEEALIADLSSNNNSYEEMSEWDEDDLFNNYNSMFEEANRLYAILDRITVSASQDYDLSNGDKIEITASFEPIADDDLSRHIKDGTVKYTVRHLQKGKTFDPFAISAVSVKFYGKPGEGTASLKILSDAEPFCYVTYEIWNTEYLSPGDEVVVTAEYDEYSLAEAGYYTPVATGKAYVFELPKNIVLSKNDLTSADISKLRSQTIKAVNDFTNRYDKKPESPETSIAHVLFVSSPTSENSFRNYEYREWYYSAVIIIGTHTCYDFNSGELAQHWFMNYFMDMQLSDEGVVPDIENTVLSSGVLYEGESLDEAVEPFLSGLTIEEIYFET